MVRAEYAATVRRLDAALAPARDAKLEVARLFLTAPAEAGLRGNCVGWFEHLLPADLALSDQMQAPRYGGWRREVAAGFLRDEPA